MIDMNEVKQLIELLTSNKLSLLKVADIEIHKDRYDPIIIQEKEEPKEIKDEFMRDLTFASSSAPELDFSEMISLYPITRVKKE